MADVGGRRRWQFREINNFKGAKALKLLIGRPKKFKILDHSATLKTRFREGVFEPLENGPIWGAFGYFLVHWRRPGRWGRFLGFQNNA